MTAPLVSVKMITYNHAPFIVQAIEGVLQQKTNFPFELVIGEDCSTDGTREIVFAYQRRYPDIIRIITSDSNVGMKTNGLRTRKACRGKYVAVCEGDDWWQHPLKLQKQVDYLETHPDCGMVHSNYDVYHESSKVLTKDYMNYRKFEVPQKPDIIDIIVRCRISFRIQACTAIFRNALCEEIIESDPYLHQSGHFLMGDTQLWAELAIKSGIAYIPESLATYRLLDESASRSKDRKKSWRFEQSDCEMKLYLCDKYDLSKGIRRERELAWCKHSLRLAFHEGKASLAQEVKEKKGSLTLREWFLYVGARYKIIQHIFTNAVYFRDLIKGRSNADA